MKDFIIQCSTKKLIGISVSVSILLLSVYFVVLTSSSNVSESLLKELSSNNIAFSTQDAKITWSGIFPAISFKNVSVSPSRNVVVAAKEVEASVSSLSWDMGNVDISNIFIKRASIAVKSKDGKVNKVHIKQATGDLTFADNGVLVHQLKMLDESGKGYVRLSDLFIGENKLSGRVRIDNLNASPYLSMLGYDSSISSLTVKKSKLYFDAGKRLSLSGDVSLANVALSDSASTNFLVSVAHGKIASGAMRFRSISFHIGNEKEGVVLGSIKANSDSFDIESGKVYISSDKKLSGSASTSSLKGLTGFDINVSGALDNPDISVDKGFVLKNVAGAGVGAIIGGVVGTSLGPAGTIIGAGLGTKIDNAISSIFHK